MVCVRQITALKQVENFYNLTNRPLGIKSDGLCANCPRLQCQGCPRSNLSGMSPVRTRGAPPPSPLFDSKIFLQKDLDSNLDMQSIESLPASN